MEYSEDLKMGSMTLLDLLSRTRSVKPWLPLASALDELDIQPFNPTSVEMYKAAKKNLVFEHYAEELTEQQIGTYGNLHPLRWEMMRERPEKNSFASRSTHTNTVATGYIVGHEEEAIRRSGQVQGWDVRFYYEAQRQSMPQAKFLRWRRMYLNEARMSAGVPEFVDRKIAQVVDKIPEATIQVDTLESKTEFYDPFLLVSFQREEYYIEVWGDDEREFQR